MAIEKMSQTIVASRCLIENPANPCEILFVRRSDTAINNPGMWELPGGKLDDGESQPQGRDREILQETNLVISTKPGVAFVTEDYIEKGENAGSPLTSIFEIATVESGELEVSDEHTAHAWETPEDATNQLELTPLTRKALNALMGHLALKTSRR